jgi:hypothetical protein
MIDNQTIHKLSELIPKKDIKSLQDIVIFQDENGDYVLFNKYTIHKSDVGYTVSIDHIHNTYVFYSLKNATVWCTLDKRNKILEASTVLNLDQKLAGLDSSIVIQSSLVKRAKNDDDKLVYIAKLSQARAVKRKVLREIDDFIVDSKRWQLSRMNRKPA